MRTIPVSVATLAGSVLLLSALTGCAGSGAPGASGGDPARPDAERVAAVDCLAPGLRHFSDFGIPEPTDGDHAPAPDAGGVPADFVPAEAVLCAGAFDADIDGVSWLAISETRYEGDLTDLVAALSVADDPQSTGACTMDYEMVPELWVVDEAGDAIRAAWPLDGCRKTKPEVREALAALPVVEEKMHPISRMDTGDPFASCLSQLPPGVENGTELEPAPIESAPAEVPSEEPVPGQSAAPDYAADAECG